MGTETVEREWDPPFGRSLAEGKCKYPECHCKKLCVFAETKVIRSEGHIKTTCSQKSKDDRMSDEEIKLEFERLQAELIKPYMGQIAEAVVKYGPDVKTVITHEDGEMKLTFITPEEFYIKE